MIADDARRTTRVAGPPAAPGDKGPGDMGPGDMAPGDMGPGDMEMT